MEKQRILIVDDDENIAELISLYLVKECFAPRIEGQGTAALRGCPATPPPLDLIRNTNRTLSF